MSFTPLNPIKVILVLIFHTIDSLGYNLPVIGLKTYEALSPSLELSCKIIG